MLSDKLEPNIDDHSGGANWSDNISLYKPQPVSLTETVIGLIFSIILSNVSSRTLRLKAWSLYKPSGSVALNVNSRDWSCS